jgi:23S rRNA pseudouridine1911/1915/1917 synthase
MSRRIPSIRYVDNHVLVVEKPAGMLSQADHTGDPDVLSLMKEWVGTTYNKPGKVYLGLVHRLDRPASGLMVLARTSKAASRLVQQFSERSVEKVYMAWLEGTPPHEATWEDHLSKLDREVRVVDSGAPGAKRASLSLQTIGTYGGCSLVAIRLHTGRAHQIRVQCASRGFPLVGDLRYGARQELDGKNLALHAGGLVLDHPTRRERLAWASQPSEAWPPQVRNEIASWLAQWQEGHGFPDTLPPLTAS